MIIGLKNLCSGDELICYANEVNDNFVTQLVMKVTGVCDGYAILSDWIFSKDRYQCMVLPARHFIRYEPSILSIDALNAILTTDRKSIDEHGNILELKDEDHADNQQETAVQGT